MGDTGAASTYGEYLEQIDSLGESADMITILPEVLLEVRHEPVLAQFMEANGVGQRETSTPFVTATGRTSGRRRIRAFAAAWSACSLLCVTTAMAMPIRQTSTRGSRPGEGSGDLPSEEVFAEWWPIVTGEPMIRATLTSFPLAWNGPGPMVPDFAPVENPAVLRQLMRAVIEGYEEADNLARSAGRRSSLRRIECQNTIVYQR